LRTGAGDRFRDSARSGHYCASRTLVYRLIGKVGADAEHDDLVERIGKYSVEITAGESDR
jgi:hypothetical protein